LATFDSNTVLYAIVRQSLSSQSQSQWGDVCLFVDKEEAHDTATILQSEADWMCSRGGPVIQYTVEERKIHGKRPVTKRDDWKQPEQSLVDAYYSK
jgi:hypothetical protein